MLKKTQIFFLLCLTQILYSQENALDLINTSSKSSSVNNYISNVNLVTDTPVEIMNLVIAIKDHPVFDDSWPRIDNNPEYPNEKHPLVGTFADGKLLRDFISERGSIGVDEWYSAQMEEYFSKNSNGRFEVSIITPKTPDGKAYRTNNNYQYWINRNEGSDQGYIMRYQNWREIGEEALQKVLNDNPGILDEVKLLNIVYLVNRAEFTRDEYSAFSPDIKHFFLADDGDTLYNGYITMLYHFESLLHETMHRLGSLMGEPFGFEGLPDRTTQPFFDYPLNMTWGFDLMYNKAPLPTKYSMYGTFPMLSVDRVFLGWIPQQDIYVLKGRNVDNIHLVDVNKELTPIERAEGYKRLLKVMIHENFDGDLDEYFLCEFRNGSNFDRNFYNAYEDYIHTGLLIWHVKENSEMLNRQRNTDHFIDLEVAVPYNGWNNNPIPDDNFPRDYNRPYSWREKFNASGDFDYLDDDSSPPFYPDGGVHSWELTDTTHEKWAPFFLRRNSLASNFFTDREIRGVVTNKFNGFTRPSSDDWAGRNTNISIHNIKQFDDYMTLDVAFDGGVVSVNSEMHDEMDYYLGNAYPNPFNSETNFSFTLPEDSYTSLNLYDAKGELVKRIINKRLNRGTHSVQLDASGLSSGVYFYRLLTDKYYSAKKALLLN